LNQTFFEQKLHVSVNIRDVFKTMITKFTYNLGNMYTFGDRYADNQRIGFNIRYQFGIKTKEERKHLFKDSDEEM